MKRLREESGRRQEDVAAAARACGLKWGRSTVAMLEAGQRRLDPEELLLLPVILQVSGVGSHALADLLSDGAMVELTPEASVSKAGLVKLVDPSQGPFTLEKGDWRAPRLATGGQVLEAWAERQAKKEAAGWGEPWQRGWTEAEMTMARRDASGDAEQKAARKLGVDAVDVAMAAGRLFGRSLTAERDARVQASADAAPRTLRALRGHATRELTEVLRPYVTKEKR